MAKVTIRETPLGELRYGAWLGECAEGHPNLEADTLEGMVDGLINHAFECTDGFLVATDPHGNHVTINGITPFNVYRDFSGRNLVNSGWWMFAIVEVIA